MPKNKIVTQEAWFEAHKSHLAREKELIPKVLVGDSFVILGRLCGVIPCCRRRFGDGISIEVAG